MMRGTLPSTTRAAVLHGHGQDLQIEDLPLPDALPDGALIARVAVTTLCGSDAELWTGAMGWPGMLPIVLGHEMVGEIVAIGSEARDATGRVLALGDRIGWSESICGHCYACTVLHEPVMCENRGYGMRQRADQPPYVVGGLSEYSYVSADAQVLRLPEELDLRLAAAAGCAMKTVLRGIGRVGGVRLGEHVVIQGAGALGLFATAAARLAGAGSVTVIGGPADRLRLAERFGADRTLGLELESAERVDEVRAATGGRGADLVLDMAGAPGVGDEGVRLAGPTARYLIVGTTAEAPTPIPLGLLMKKQLTIVGSVNGDIGDYARAIRLFADHPDAAPWTEIFTPSYSLADAGTALELLVRQDAIKPVVEPSLTTSSATTSAPNARKDAL